MRIKGCRQILMLSLALVMTLSACGGGPYVIHEGLKPLSPGYPETYTYYASQPVCCEGIIINVDSVQPDLVWEAFPQAGHLPNTSGKPVVAITDVVYELKIMENSDIVYERTGLREARHKVEIELRPKTNYEWSIRPVFMLNGRLKVGRWTTLTVLTERYDPLNMLKGRNSFIKYPSFRTPASQPREESPQQP